MLKSLEIKGFRFLGARKIGKGALLICPIFFNRFDAPLKKPTKHIVLLLKNTMGNSQDFADHVMLQKRLWHSPGELVRYQQ